MLSRSKKGKNTFSPDLTTCSDIIFTLLIFYILTQNFVTRLAVDLPEITSREQILTQKTQRIEINEAGSISLNDKKLFDNWRQELEYSFKGLASGTQFMISAHKKAPSGVVIEIIDKLASLGVKHIGFGGITRPLDAEAN